MVVWLFIEWENYKITSRIRPRASVEDLPRAIVLRALGIFDCERLFFSLGVESIACSPYT